MSRTINQKRQLQYNHTGSKSEREALAFKMNQAGRNPKKKGGGKKRGVKGKKRSKRGGGQ